MQSLVVLRAAWPVLVLRCPAHFDAGWIETLDTELRAVFAKKERFALITDTQAIEALPGAKERRLLADWAASPEQLAHTARYNVGSSTIVANAVVRGGLQALYWFWTPASPQHAAKDFDAAWAWCIGRLRDEGVALPKPEQELRALADAERARVLRVAG